MFTPIVENSVTPLLQSLRQKLAREEGLCTFLDNEAKPIPPTSFGVPVDRNPETTQIMTKRENEAHSLVDTQEKVKLSGRDTLMVIDAQVDFLSGLLALLPNDQQAQDEIVQRNNWLADQVARKKGHVVYTGDCHKETDSDVANTDYGKHCMEGTPGQHLAKGLVPTSIPCDKRTYLQKTQFSMAGGELVKTGQNDKAPKDRTISEQKFYAFLQKKPEKQATPDRYILTGVAANICVYNTAKDLLEAGKEVVIVLDATFPLKGIEAIEEKKMLAELKSSGAKIVLSSQIQTY